MLSLSIFAEGLFRENRRVYKEIDALLRIWFCLIKEKQIPLGFLLLRDTTFFNWIIMNKFVEIFLRS